MHTSYGERDWELWRQSDHFQFWEQNRGICLHGLKPQRCSVTEHILEMKTVVGPFLSAVISRPRTWKAACSFRGSKSYGTIDEQIGWGAQDLTLSQAPWWSDRYFWTPVISTVLSQSFQVSFLSLYTENQLEARAFAVFVCEEIDCFPNLSSMTNRLHSCL